MQRIQDKLLKAVECLEYFTMNQWQFRDENVRSLLTSLNANDRKTFDFDVCHIQWAQYIERYVLGFRKYLFKQKMDTLPATRKQMTRLVVLEGEDGEWSNGTNVIFSLAGCTGSTRWSRCCRWSLSGASLWPVRNGCVTCGCGLCTWPCKWCAWCRSCRVPGWWLEAGAIHLLLL